jgi:hypothetical protein
MGDFEAMNADLHAALTKHVALTVGWGGSTSNLARAAILPDTVRTVAAWRIGSHLLGHNLASLTHFCRPVGVGLFRGYNYHRDRSLPDLNLPDHDVEPKPDGWPVALTDEEKARDPVAVLVRGAASRGDSIALDELTFPTAATMAAWLEGCVSGKAWESFDVISGMICHFAQDCAVPHHAMGLLGDGHQAFEGDASERFPKLVESIEMRQQIDHALLSADDSPVFSCRAICESTAEDADLSMARLVWARWVWRSTWQRFVDESIFRAARATTAVLVRLGRLSPKD